VKTEETANVNKLEYSGQDKEDIINENFKTDTAYYYLCRTPGSMTGFCGLLIFSIIKRQLSIMTVRVIIIILIFNRVIFLLKCTELMINVLLLSSKPNVWLYGLKGLDTLSEQI
jgi:hypothetical protein